MSASAPSDPEPEPLHPQRLTWAAMLASWVDFARSAVSLPRDQAGNRMRESVPDIIMLQAVWFSLVHLDELDASQRALGLDRAEVLIEKHRSLLEQRWKEQMPPLLAELITDAQQALAQAHQRG